jgi:hypothetical protein
MRTGLTSRVWLLGTALLLPFTACDSDSAVDVTL